MFLMSNLFLLFCIEKTNKINFLLTENLNTLSVVSNKYNSKKLSGYDERFPLNNTNSDNIELYNIAIFLEKKKLLDILQNENVSLMTKIFLLNDNTIRPHNIFAGGLMDNFDFENF